MIESRRFVYLLFVACVLFANKSIAQVKIGDNHTKINAGSLLELESHDKGVLFPRIQLDANLKLWILQGTPADGMVVYNTNPANPYGLYVWYNKQWNLLGGGGASGDVDYLEFDQSTRKLIDDGDTAVIPSARVQNVTSEDELLNFLKNKYPTEGDIFNLPSKGIYIRNDSIDAKTVQGGYIFVSTVQDPGYILYAALNEVSATHIDPEKFVKGLNKAFYLRPEDGATIKVNPPPTEGGYYAFAIPSKWPAPRIFLKVANSGGGFFKLNNCWRVARNLEYQGLNYQVWALDVPLTAQVMDPDLEFKIE